MQLNEKIFGWAESEQQRGKTMDKSRLRLADISLPQTPDPPTPFSPTTLSQHSFIRQVYKLGFFMSYNYITLDGFFFGNLSAVDSSP